MEHDLLGYALNALEPADKSEVEAYLRGHPEAISKVDALRQSFEPLSWDKAIAPPSGLAERTMAHIAANQAPQHAEKAIGVAGIPWRRILAMAAMVVGMVTAGGVGMAWIGGLRSQRPGGEGNVAQVTACKDNLHKAFTSLWSYASTHDHKFPVVTTSGQPPANAGGQVFKVLKESKVLPADVQLTCPGGSDSASYAYSLGYNQAGKVVGPGLEAGKPTSLMPLMADCEPADPVHGGQSNSHGGGGQNVLFSDGHVTYCTSRYVGYNQDDIYLNRNKKVAAGLEWSDAVLYSGMPGQ